MTLDDFTSVFAVLALQLRFTDADEATIRGYYEALKDLDLELVQMAAQRLAAEPGTNESWFPRTPEWRALVAKIDTARTDELRKRLRSLPVPLCASCGDTSWDKRADGVVPCECRRLRRLEVLGRRSMPALVVGAEPPKPTALADITALIRAKPMPAARRVASTLSDWRNDPTLDRDDPIIAAELARTKGAAS